MEPSQDLIDSIYHEKVLRARRSAPEGKLLAGAKLFEYAREIARCGIRAQYPDASPEKIREEFQRRLKIARFMESRQ